MPQSRPQPSTILIVGGGALGVSTAISLLQRPKYSNTAITIVDASPKFPNRSAASWDTSRILRADYAEKAYTKLVSQARKYWNYVSSDAWGGAGRYHDAPLLLTSQPGVDGHVDGYLEESLANVKDLARSGDFDFSLNDIKELPNKEAIKGASGFPGTSGDFGYMNDKCGWVNAEAVVKYLYEKLEQVGRDRVEVKLASKVRQLLYEGHGSSLRCSGVEIEGGTHLYADLTILAAGAWTPSLIDFHGRAVATGQVLSYITLTEAEQQTLSPMPIYFNMSRGMFMVPAHNGELKWGRHGYGYQNPTPMHLEGKDVLVSVPRPDLPIPAEAETACKEFLLELFPHWKDKQVTKTRLCWYCDTPTGDFLIDYHPHYQDLFLVTGDSGHGFKVLPVIGDKVVDAIDGELDQDLQQLWRWREAAPGPWSGTDDGTRGGRRGMILNDEIEAGT
ncbi:hypothetical protein CLAIMM_07721 [Cladophialophora immunda]|nr:hypothetical protein CLAIMM_07721 [Cladophialophora immunda]